MKSKKKRVLSSFLLILLICSLIGCGFAEGFEEGFRASFEETDTRSPETSDSQTEDEPADTPTEAPLPTEELLTTTEPTNSPTPEPTTAPTATPIPTATPKPTKAPTSTPKPTKAPVKKLSLSDIPPYSGKASVSVFGNKPSFTDEDMTVESFESYSPLDKLGRCGVAFANIGRDIMPTEERDTIGMVKPSGWHTVKYNIIEDLFLYNRCHLIAFCLSGENANEKNLITGTRYLNTEGMLPHETKVANYVESTENHVLYRVTPIYDGNNLLCSGVQIEAYSVEDNGKGICFNVFCYNAEPGIVIDYTTGDSHLEEEDTKDTVERGPSTSTEQSYVLNTNTKKFHYPSCSSVGTIKDKNRDDFTGDRQELINRGYDPCKRCYP